MTHSLHNLHIALLHEGMVDKQNKAITSSLTLIDIHDIARSSRTYGVGGVYIAHPSPALQRLARTLHEHWHDGFGATYNPNRKEALTGVHIVSGLDEAITKIDMQYGNLPQLIATSAKDGEDRVSFQNVQELLDTDNAPLLLMLGTGWGMGEELLARADLFLEPIQGAGKYNHLSVRSACAIMLDRLAG